MRRFYAPSSSFSDSAVHLGEDETRHLRDVLRLHPGDEVSVFDGAGREFRCSIAAIEKKNSQLSVLEEIAPASPESHLELTVAPTVLNGERYDLIVQKSVELGASTLIPLITVRCDVKLQDASKRLERWRRIAMEATKQCGRAKLMEICEPLSFGELLANESRNDILMFSERDGRGFGEVEPIKKLTALFGPKGGWDDGELQTAADQGISIITLGGRILRAETAAIGITAILQHRYGDIN